MTNFLILPEPTIIDPLAVPIEDQKTAYNKDFGTTSGTVAEGNITNLAKKGVDSISRINSVFDDTQTLGDPGAGLFRLNSTEDALFISYTQNQGSDIKAILENLNVGYVLKIQAEDNKYRIFNVTGLITDNTTWAVIPILVDNSGDNFVDGDLCGLLTVAKGFIPDEKDITSKDGKLEFKDRDESGNQKGYKIIRPNFNFSSIPSGYNNSIWVIQNTHNLGGGNWAVPSGVILENAGGFISNYGIITGDNTEIDSGVNAMFDGSGDILGTWNVEKTFVQWFGATNDKTTDDTNAFKSALQISDKIYTNSAEHLLTEYLEGVLIASNPVDLGGKSGGIVVKDTSRPYQNERNLVDILQKRTIVKGSYYRADAGDLYVGYTFEDDAFEEEYVSAVEYKFVRNDDGMLLLRGVFSGKADIALSKAAEFTVDSGSLNTGTAKNAYAQSAGTTLSGSFTGSALYFQSRIDTNGGIWKFTLDNGMIFNISTWSDIINNNNSIKLAELNYGNYNYTLEFLGDDPFHVPTNGVGNSRGWIFHTPAVPEEQPLRISNFIPLDTINKVDIIPDSTIIDFAFAAKAADAAYASQWVPIHSGVTGVSIDISFKLIVDGKLISTSTTIVDSGFKPFKQLRLACNFDSANPSEPARKMWDHKVIHSFNNVGVLNISNRLSFHIDTKINGYGTMLACNPSVFERKIDSLDGEVSPLLIDGSDVYKAYSPKSLCFAGDADGVLGLSHVVAISANDLNDSCCENRNWAQPLRFQEDWRDATLSKVYWRMTSPNTVISAGEIIYESSDIFCASGVRSPQSFI